MIKYSSYSNSKILYKNNLLTSTSQHPYSKKVWKLLNDASLTFQNCVKKAFFDVPYEKNLKKSLKCDLNIFYIIKAFF